MKTAFVLGVGIVIGVGIGATFVQGLHAQSKAPVYLIAENDVTNPEAYAKEYLPKAQPLIKQHGGRYVAAGKATPFAGDPPKSRVVILQWDSMEQLKGWFDSPEYREARKLGEKYAKFRNFAVEGVAQQPQ